MTTDEMPADVERAMANAIRWPQLRLFDLPAVDRYPVCTRARANLDRLG
jgi:hypothetical protein